MNRTPHVCTDAGIQAPQFREPIKVAIGGHDRGAGQAAHDRRVHEIAGTHPGPATGPFTRRQHVVSWDGHNPPPHETSEGVKDRRTRRAHFGRQVPVQQLLEDLRIGHKGVGELGHQPQDLDAGGF
jgi:hypothetical protein